MQGFQSGSYFQTLLGDTKIDKYIFRPYDLLKVTFVSFQKGFKMNSMQLSFPSLDGI